MKKFFAHESSIVQTDAVGEGTTIWAFVNILKGAKIGSHTNICDQCFIENDVIIGNNVTIKCGVYLWDGITIGDNVFIGPGAAFTNDLYPRSKNVEYKQLKTFINDGASIGANATLLCGLTIGKNALVGAGAVVTKDVPDYALVIGNPAKIQKYLCACTKEIIMSESLYQCTCGEKYKIVNGKVHKI